MTAFLKELVLAFRALRKSPGFFAAAVISLALGLASNSTIFAAIDAFLVRPLPYDRPDELVQIWSTEPDRGWTQQNVSLPDYLDWRRESRLLDLAAYDGISLNLTGKEQPERLLGVLETNLFGVLKAPPLLGRVIRPDEELAGGPHVAVLSHHFWRNRFSSDSGIIGRTLTLSGESYTVVGVMGPKFQVPDNRADLWVPLAPNGKELRNDRSLDVIGRMASSTGMHQATTELSGIADRLGRTYPDDAGLGVNLVTLKNQIYNPTFRQASLICTVAVAFVLLIACANVANLLLARGAVRGRELAVRAALGAGRWRIIRQLLAESLIIALAGGALGLLLSFWGVKGLVSLMPPWFPRMDEIAVNGRLLLYTLGISVASGLIFGLIPALHSSRADLYSSLRETGRTGSPGARQGRLRKSFVVAEISLALVLLIAAGLLIKASIRMQHTDLGFEPAGVLTARITLPDREYPDSSRIIPFYENLLARLQAIPQVTSAGATTLLPMNGGSSTYYTIEGEPAPDKGKEPVVQVRMVTPGYLDAMRMPLRRGRAFTQEDRLEARPVALVNEAMVRRHWTTGDPVGHRVVFSSGPYEIVGVVADARDFGPDDETPALVYLPEFQRGSRGLSLAIRTSGDPASLTPALREAVRIGDAGVPIYDLQTMGELVANDRRGDSIMPKLLGIFGGVALVLAVLGVYSVMAYTVAQRTQEVGIRMALGAKAGDIITLIVRQGSALALTGTVIGLVLAFATTRGLSAFLFGVSAFDPVIFGGVSLALGGAALGASLFPARRASRVSPIVALKHE